MSRKTKLVALVMVAVMMLLVFGCSSAGEPKEEPKEEPKAEQPKAEEPKISYPEKPIEMTVLFGAGGGADLVARKLADIAQKELGQPIPVVNRTGASGAVGYTYVKDQKPDGYNIVWNSNSISTAYYAGNMDFNYEAFDYVSRMTNEPVSIAVAADAPWQTLEEFVQYAKDNPGKVKIGNSGLGSFTHLAAVALANEAEIDVKHVPFGKGLAVASLLSGEIQASSQLTAEIMSQAEAGQVRVLAVTGEERTSALPDVPTAKEQGYDVTLALWRGFAVPKGTPKEVIDILDSAFEKAVKSDEFKQFADEMAVDIAYLGPEDFAAFVAEDDKVMAELMDQVGLKKQ